ncbi:uncharacterized protein N7503_002457 [Penicillium pulvis]|uniref:uncharacterized protein n=1 Tax=Penicillium pulvis TaxID=1562058 RepID=UPI002548E1B4|nr:uncharacterized protein N7503_002457 [Penicillium pulvis]KAJ5810239.1 hypothetical protein N7503_002457 [Penicillium pulvis]
MAAKAPLCHDDYTVGWICALPLEMAAAKLMLDAIHPNLPRPSTDQNTYILGNIDKHNIVIACLPSGAYGTVSAAVVATQLLSSFRSIRFGLMVGIGGGVPSSNADIRLGDIVVSQPADISGGVIQYDLGKALSGGRFQRTGMLNRPPKVLLTALATLQAHHFTDDSRVLEFISDIQIKTTPRRATTFTRPTQEDCLYQPEYIHRGSDTCIDCDRSKLVPRLSRDYKELEPVIHYGLIASANQVVKDGRQRDQLARDLGVLCVEMEAAGLMNDFPCLVIRGICDYADSHKTKEWQGYAAAVAAAYAKELILAVPIYSIETTLIAQDTLVDSVHRFNVPLDLTTMPMIINFVGRQDELDSLWQYLQPTDTPPSQKVAILHGLGGIGKTQLAIRFARDHRDHFTAIFWLNGKNLNTLLQSLSFTLNRILGQGWDSKATNDREVEQRARHMLRWLALDGNSRWLIIFDNIDQYSPFNSAIGDRYDIWEFFPKAYYGSILITSRLQDLTELGKSFPVHRLDSYNSTQLLLQSSGLSTENTISKLDSNLDILTLTDRLGGLPLAIIIAGAFMRETGTSITEIFSELQQRLLPHANHIYHLDLLDDNIEIWWAFLRLGDLYYYQGKLKEAEEMFQRALAGYKKALGPDDLSTLKAVNNLGVVYNAQSKLKEAEEMFQRALLGYEKAQGPEDISTLEMVNNLGGLYRIQGKLKEAEQMYQRALAGKEKVLGPDHISTLDMVTNVAGLFFSQGKLRKAEQMYQRGLAGYKKALAPNHISILDTVNNLGILYENQGKLKEAEDMYERALTGKEKVLGPDHIYTLETVKNLGNLYKVQGKLKEAEQMYQRALAGKEKALGLKDRTQ